MTGPPVPVPILIVWLAAWLLFAIFPGIGPAAARDAHTTRHKGL